VAVGGGKPQLSPQLLSEAGAAFVVVGVAGPFAGEVAGSAGAELGLQAAPGGAEVDADGGEWVTFFFDPFEGDAVAAGALDEGECAGVAAVVAGVFEEAGVEGLGFEVAEEAPGRDEGGSAPGFAGTASAHGEADDDAVLLAGGPVEDDALAKVLLTGAVLPGDGAEGCAAGLGSEAVEGADGGAVDDLRGVSAHLCADVGELRLDVNVDGHVNLRLAVGRGVGSRSRVLRRGRWWFV
jgi:hypothetical protein